MRQEGVFLTVLWTSAGLALAVGALIGLRGLSTSGFSFALGVGRTVALVGLVFAAYLAVGSAVALPVALGSGHGASGAAMSWTLRACGALTLWFVLGITFLPLKGSELNVRAGRLTTLELNVIGLVLVLVAGALAAWAVGALVPRAVSLLLSRLGPTGAGVLGATLAAVAAALIVAGSARRAGGLAKLELPAGFRAGSAPQVVVVGVDGCEWSMLGPLVEAGKLPTFARLMEAGCHGPLRSVEPLISPSIWTTIATGKTSEKHGVADFVNERGVPVNATMVRAAPLWEIASAHGVRVGVVGWYVTWPASRVNGFVVSDRMHSLLRGPTQILHALSGRSTNERLEDFGRFTLDPGYKRLPRTDPLYRENRIVDEPLRWGFLRDRIYGDAMVALARLFRPRFAAVYYRGVDFVQHFFWRYADPAPFGGVPADERERFGSVIANYYAYQDRLLARLLDALGDDVNVLLVSDHGFRARLDPKPGMPELTGRHDMVGVFIAAGPAFRAGGRTEGMTVLDVAPTALAVMGLPVPEDMDGRPFTAIIREEHLKRFPVATVPSYDRLVQRRAAQDGPADENESIREQLRSLGYID
jgi:hypothetical protein